MARTSMLGTGPRRAVLLLAVVLGLLAMHHVAASAPAHAAPAAAVEHDGDRSPDRDGGGGHSGGQHMLATCLAVLTAGIALLVALTLFGVVTDPGGGRDRRRIVPARFDRGPPFAAPTSVRLASLCLLRV
ncbi:DUF6153 family protein [Rhodococcus sp. NPDC058532]|uniref:DUF6153 family protein n=1 Tax=Rhodococcus sp. NPDC058532 TaxID=3346540 RepID=UPI00365DB644